MTRIMNWTERSTSYVRTGGGPGSIVRTGAPLRTLFAILLVFLCLPAWSHEEAEPQKPMMVAGGGGTRIAVYEYGDPAGPGILLVHGFSQSHLSWVKQYEAPVLQKFRIVVIDLRGHGASEKPTNPESYNNSKLWADDVNAVIKAKNLKQPVIAAWSYGGFIVSDYVREHGDDDLGGIVFVGAGTQMGTEDAKTHYGPGLKLILEMLDPRQEINIPATAEFVRAASATPMSPEEFQQAFAYNMAVSPEVRSGLFARTVDSNDALAKIKKPVLIVQGEKDNVVLVAAANYIADRVRHARKSYYPNAGHSTFMEDPERFNRELAEMALRQGKPLKAVAARP
jgi:pimeloyl-ACP methyl ester carboxylesterase